MNILMEIFFRKKLTEINNPGMITPFLKKYLKEKSYETI